MRPLTLLTGRIPSSVAARLEEACEVERHDGGPLSHEELVARVPGKAALLSMVTDRVDRAVIEAGTALKVIANIGVGYNNIDLAVARERHIIVTNTPGVLTDATADLTWALILGITRRISEGERLVRARKWTGWGFDQLLGMELRERQLGIVGYGRIGQAVAARAAGFGMRVAFAVRAASAAAAAPDAEAMALDRLLATSDVVSLHVPLRDDTRHLINQAALARMKRGAYLVNTSRGPVVDETALVWALKNRLIAGAALDVYEREPQIEQGLFELENVLLVPHLGSATTDTRTAMARLAVDNVIAVLSGASPLTPVS
jgi:glyoxylate reductase